MAAVPLLPSDVAVMVTAPDATAVTMPACETEAIAMLEVAHVIARPFRATPFASRATAASCDVAPPTVTCAVGGVTVTAATGVRTDTVAEAVFPSKVTETVVVPSATPVTSPVPDTVATANEALPHVNVRPDTTVPDEARAVAVSCVAQLFLHARNCSICDHAGQPATAAPSDSEALA